MKTHVYHITYSPESHNVHLLFLGCNMFCRGCIRRAHTWDSHLDTIPESPPTPDLLTLSDVFAAIGNRPVNRVFFFGDDPTLDPHLASLAEGLQTRYRAKNTLLTNGLILPPYQFFDDIQLSIKAVSPALHRDFTGVDVAQALENFRKLAALGAPLRSESIVIPQYIDAPEIERIAAFIADVSPEIPYRLDAYIPVPGAPWRRPTPEEMALAEDAARKHLRNVSTLHSGGNGKRHKMVRLI